VRPAPNAGTDGTLITCSGARPTNAQLFAQLGGTPDTGGTWSNTGNVFTYTVAMASPCMQSSTSRVTVVIESLIAEAGDAKIISCDPATAELNGVGSSTGTDITYLWTGGTILMGANTLNPVVGASGTYKLTVTNTSTGCSAQDAVQVTRNTEIPVFSISETDTNQYTIMASGGIGPYQYSINEANNYSDNPVFKIDTSGEYSIYVKDSKGCFSIEKKYLTYSGILFPEFLSPDGNGNNDYWYPTRIEDYPNLEVSIFDRYQRLIIRFNGNNELGWDGTYQGKPLPSGDYWYVVKTNNNKDDREYIGGMTLFR
jgi:gliding motility-associated-like protein